MPKQILKIDQFHGGLNSHADPRDIADNQLSALQNASVSSIGRIVVAGGGSPITTNSFPLASGDSGIIAGYNLFAWAADYNLAGDANTPSNFLTVWDDGGKIFYWVVDPAGSGTWAEMDGTLSAFWTSSSKPCFYIVDGALRISDGDTTNTEESIWFGYIDRDSFTGASGSGEITHTAGWESYVQELKKPDAGVGLGGDYLSLGGSGSAGAPAIDEADITANAVSIWVRNAKDQLNKMADSNIDDVDAADWKKYEHTDGGYIFNQTITETTSHSGDKFFKMFYNIGGGTDPVSDVKMGWRGIVNLTEGDLVSEQTNSPQTFAYGQSIYMLVRLPSQTSKDYWDVGGHDETGDGHNFDFNDHVDENVIRVYSDGDVSGSDLDTNDDSGSSYMEWKIGNPLTDGWKVGDYRVLEFPYDSYDAIINGGSTDISYPDTFTIDTWGLSWMFHGLKTGGTAISDVDALDTCFEWSDIFVGDSGLVFEDPVNDGKKKWGYSNVYGKTQESGIYSFTNELTLTDNGFAAGLTVFHHAAIHGDASTADNRITGANIYFFDEDDVSYRVAECDFVDGLKSVTASNFPTDTPWYQLNADARYSNTVTFQQIPIFSTFESLHGYGEIEGSDQNFKASYANATLSNRRLFVGPVNIDKQDGKGLSWKYDTMIATSPGEYDLFPHSANDILVAKEDGDSIIAMVAYADRILQFKSNTMYLINITKSTEYLEDTFRGKGVAHPAAVCKTDYGIAWANLNGCFFYDGQKVENLSDMKISDNDWSGHMDSNSLVGYHSNSRKIIVTGGGTYNRDAYVFDLVIKSWAYLSNVFTNNVMSNFVNNQDNNLLWCNEGDGLYKWTESAIATSSFSVKTKDFDFGHPGQRKKVYRVRMSVKGDASSLVIKYTTEGEINVMRSFTESFTDYGSSGLFGVGDWQHIYFTPDVSSESNNIYSFQIHISGTAAADFEINDISIVYRLKPVK